PALAAQLRQPLDAVEIPDAQAPAPGLDHGVFIPFMPAVARAGMPVTPPPSQRDRDGAREPRIGGTRQPLRTHNILIVGTDMTYHNLHHFMGQNRHASTIR
ncbi:MAG: dioxygenase, partial [Komagataeibacter rhaeticus]